MIEWRPPLSVRAQAQTNCGKAATRQPYDSDCFILAAIGADIERDTAETAARFTECFTSILRAQWLK